MIGWLPEENRDVLRRLILDHKVKSVIEVGAFVGKSAVFFAQQGLQVTTIEPFTASELGYVKAEKDKREAAENQMENFFENTRYYSGITLLQGTSEEVHAANSELTADLIYLDGSHTYGDVKKDIQLWLPRAKKVLCGDDYTAGWASVRKAVNEMLPDANTKQRVWYYNKV